MIEVRIEAHPGLPHIACSVEPIAGRRDVLVGAQDEDVMHVVVDALATLGPGLAPIIADVDAADLDASDHTVGRVRMDTETPDVGLVAVARRMPLVTRREILEALEFVPRLAVVGGDVEMGRMGPCLKALAIRTRDD
jgi:hypothetical protein